MLLKLVPDQTSVPFTKWRSIAAVFSAIMVVGSIFAVTNMGLNFGVDFKGGGTIEVSDTEPIDVEAVRRAVNDLGLGEVRVQETISQNGSASGVSIFVEQQDAAGDAEDAEKDGESAQ